LVFAKSTDFAHLAADVKAMRRIAIADGISELAISELMLPCR
jgi:hypothetical protein